jgi:hypothetical protein
MTEVDGKIIATTDDPRNIATGDEEQYYSHQPVQELQRLQAPSL